MRWTEIGSQLAMYYGSVALWMADHPAEIDIAVVVGILGTVLVLYRRKIRMYRRLARLVRGANMRRKDRLRYQQMKFEDAIVDAALDMIMDGDMDDAQMKDWFRLFGESYDMVGLIPVRDQASIKRGCLMRMKFRHGLQPIRIPGGHPVKDLKADPSYKPTDYPDVVVVVGLAQSKWLKE